MSVETLARKCLFSRSVAAAFAPKLKQLLYVFLPIFSAHFVAWHRLYSKSLVHRVLCKVSCGRQLARRLGYVAVAVWSVGWEAIVASKD